MFFVLIWKVRNKLFLETIGSKDPRSIGRILVYNQNVENISVSIALVLFLSSK